MILPPPCCLHDRMGGVARHERAGEVGVEHLPPLARASSSCGGFRMLIPALFTSTSSRPSRSDRLRPRARTTAASSVTSTSIAIALAPSAFQLGHRAPALVAIRCPPPRSRRPPPPCRAPCRGRCRRCRPSPPPRARSRSNARLRSVTVQCAPPCRGSPGPVSVSHRFGSDSSSLPGIEIAAWEAAASTRVGRRTGARPSPTSAAYSRACRARRSRVALVAREIGSTRTPPWRAAAPRSSSRPARPRRAGPRRGSTPRAPRATTSGRPSASAIIWTQAAERTSAPPEATISWSGAVSGARRS